MEQWNYKDAQALFEQQLSKAGSHQDWLELKNQYTSRKNGLIVKLLAELRHVPKEHKPKMGREINLFKREVELALKNHPHHTPTKKSKSSGMDLTLPGVIPDHGSFHPLYQVMDDMVQFFLNMGYDVADGPECENTFYNFEALNTPEFHPAREDADTFYIHDDLLLRTQTSGVQIRYMEKRKPPFRMIAPGKVFRRDDDVTHSPMFHQLEGLVVGEHITFAHLKGTLEAFAKHLFGEQTRIRLRPSYFPFTEPSAEVDVTCPFCADGCRVCQQSTWIEVLGCGMVDPNVFKAVHYDPELTGFAFGIGIERVAMLKLGIPDIRLFYQNDKRFLDQFRRG
ncbi:MAG: phenylalanine--tRNA ligase subunit alpha [Acidobacteria bacterium]|nr:MAG: phenylalanine--tRNA ligase subunit alpha [Acidobacteriota bacterium]